MALLSNFLAISHPEPFFPRQMRVTGHMTPQSTFFVHFNIFSELFSTRFINSLSISTTKRSATTPQNKTKHWKGHRVTPENLLRVSKSIELLWKSFQTSTTSTTPPIHLHNNNFLCNTKKSTSLLINQYTTYTIHSDSIRQIRATTRPIWPIRPIRPTWPMRPLWPIRLIRPMRLIRPIRPDRFDPTYSTNHISINIPTNPTCSPTHMTYSQRIDVLNNTNSDSITLFTIHWHTQSQLHRQYSITQTLTYSITLTLKTMKMTNQFTNQSIPVAVLSQYPDSPPNVRGIEIRVSYLIYIKSSLVWSTV